MQTQSREESPSKLDSLLSARRNHVIYKDDYWQKKVEALMKEKKEILRATQQTHHEIREINQRNQLLQSLLRQKDQTIEKMQLREVIYQKLSNHSSLFSNSSI